MKINTSLTKQYFKKAITKCAFAAFLFLCSMSNAQVGIITTIAGGMGDGIPADSASIDWPQGLAHDASGNLYITDAGNNRIRKVNISTGTISTVAGNGEAYYTGDGVAATSSGLNDPYGVAVDVSGNIYS